MKLKKVFSYVLGATCALAIILGLMLMICSKTLTISTAIAVVCLSLVSGLLLLNPLSFLGLIGGICMMIFPSKIVGVIFLCVGIVGAVANFFVAKIRISP